MPATSSSRQYRPDIDGLRALAVLSVSLYHAFPEVIPGGFTGVDVFFVISGYLITSNILAERQANSFTLTGFYKRRVLRIFPALVIVLLAFLVIGWFQLFPHEYQLLGKHMAGGAGFVSNLVLWLENGYFDAVADDKFLLHLWSLGIEEQFYIFWPLLLGLAFLRSRFVLGTSLLLLASLLWCAWLTVHDARSAFFLPHTRMWELMAGALLAAPALQTRLVASGYNSAGMALMFFVGLALLSGAFWGIHSSTPFPGIAATIPVMGSALVIASGGSTKVARLLLGNKVLVAIGLVSYPLYLWHWPLLTYLRVVDSEMNHEVARAAMLALAALLATGTYHYIEKPLRYGPSRTRNVALLCAAMALTGVTGLMVANSSLAFRFPDSRALQVATTTWEFPGDMINAQGFYRSPTSQPESTLFIGDSNIQQYYPRIDEVQKKMPLIAATAIFTNSGGCAPVPNLLEEKHLWCASITTRARQLVASDPNINRVVIGAFWPNYFTSRAGYYFESEAVPLTRVALGNRGYDLGLQSLKDYIRSIRDIRDIEVVLLATIPYGDDLEPTHQWQRGLLMPLQSGDSTLGVPLEQLWARYGKLHTDLKRVANESGAQFLDPVAFLCGSTNCPARGPEGIIRYKDWSHLASAFARNHATYVDSLILPDSTHSQPEHPVKQLPGCEEPICR